MATKKKVPYYDELLEEYTKIWNGDAHMIEYCMKTLSNACKLDNGLIIIAKKRQIKKDFPVAEGMARETSEALKICDTISRSEQHFVDANMQDILQEIDNLTASPVVYSVPVEWNGYGVSIIGQLGTQRGVWDNDERYRPITKSDRNVILNMMNEESVKHEKKVKNYLKRYGLSQVRTWTYWDME